MMQKEMIQDVHCVIMRGGTSKGVFVKEADIADTINDDNRDDFILKLFGSPDARQIDGLGGADLLTSKFCLIGPPTVDGADVNYTFAQVGIEVPTVNHSINCGNLSAAVAAFAIEEGFVQPIEPMTTVNIFNTNTQKMLIGHVPIKDGKPEVYGDFAIDGVPGTGAKIEMDYAQTLGAKTGNLLPTGNAVDKLFIPEFNKEINVSIVDIANLCVFFDAEDIGLIGNEKPEEITLDIREKYQAIRLAVAAHIGLEKESAYIPFTIAVQSPKTYENIKGDVIQADQFDILGRMVGSTTLKVHKAFPGTGGTCLASACGILGSIPYSFSNGAVEKNKEIRIGHPSGINAIKIEMENSDKPTVKSVVFPRTARRIMQGTTYIKW